jgi:hypothetical protein
VSTCAQHTHYVDRCPDCRELRRRRQVCHGWAFRVHSDAEVAAIRAYLTGASPGDLSDLPEPYQRLHRSLSVDQEDE